MQKIQKFLLLTVLSAQMSVLSAGVIEQTGPLGIIGAERLSVEDINISHPIGITDNIFLPDNIIVYKPTDIPAGALKNPIFKYIFDGTAGLEIVDTNLAVYECQDGNASNRDVTNWTKVAINPILSGSGNEVLSFTALDGDTYVYNDKLYRVALDDGETLTDALINATISQNSTDPLTLSAVLYSGDSQEEVDNTDNTIIATVEKQFRLSILKRYDATIDAAQNFNSFYDKYSNSNNRQDSAWWKPSAKTALPESELIFKKTAVSVSFDKNLTKNNYKAYILMNFHGDLDDNDITLRVNNLNDFNATQEREYVHLSFNTIAYIFHQYDDKFRLGMLLDLTESTEKIPETKFSLEMHITDLNDNVITVTPENGSNIGEWKIHGYMAQIPNVTYNNDANASDIVESVLKFTNRSNLTSTAYFTIIANDGTICSVEDTDALPADTSKKYAFGVDLLAQCPDDYPKTGSFSVEVVIPTTPSSVYGSASLLNQSTNNFKDLPVYNTSTNTY